jgi:N-glycosylase/DNA lyase
MTLKVSASKLSLENTLNCGQVFCWHRDKDASWHGWIDQVPVKVWMENHKMLCVEVKEGQLDETQVKHYFGLEDNWDSIIRTFPQDPWIAQALEFSEGLRILRQPVWEGLASFICSAMKQIVQIQQINRELRNKFGTPMKSGNQFPTFLQLASYQEIHLREAKLGFRAKHLARAVQQLNENVVDLETIRHRDDVTARNELLKLAGVGPKIANCVLLFCYQRWQAFPIDVWILRGLKELYFPRKRKLTAAYLEAFTRDYFGPYGGIAQQYLFHWLRHRN